MTLRIPSVQKLNRAMEAVWLLALFLVPLVLATPEYMVSAFEVPKVALTRSLAGVLLAIWLVKEALYRCDVPAWLPMPEAWWPALRGWVRARPARLVTVAATGFLAANFLSALASYSLRVSFWGRVPGTDNFSFYNTAAYFVLFAVIAAHLKTPAQVYRLLLAIVWSATLVAAYGVLQYLDADPLGWAEYSSLGGTLRIVSSIGNPIFVGALFVLTVPVTLVLMMTTFGRDRWLATVWGVSTALQVVALLLTLSRGPWVGLAVGLGVFGALGTIVFWDARATRWIAVVTGLSALLVVLAVVGVSTWGQAPSALQGIAQRASSLQTPGEVQSLQHRLLMWEASAEVLLDRPAPAPVTDRLPLARHLIGYGPEIFPYVLPLRSSPDLEISQGLRAPSHAAHNHIIHETVELGLFGLVTYLGLLAALFGVGLFQLLRRRGALSVIQRWVLIGILAALSGRVVEEITGVPKVSDLTVFWALLGLFVALLAVAAPRAASSGQTSRSRRRDRWQSASEVVTIAWWRIGLTGVIVLLLAFFTWTKNVDYVIAARTGSVLLDEAAAGNTSRALTLVDQAIGRAPDVSTYHLWRGQLFAELSANATDEDSRLELARDAHAANMRAVELDPLSPRTVEVTALSALVLANLRAEGMREDAQRLFGLLTDLQPLRWSGWNRLANIYLLLGDSEAAVAAAQRSIEATGTEVRASYTSEAHLFAAIAKQRLGRTEEALESVVRSLDAGGLQGDQLDAAGELRVDIEAALGQ